MLDTIKQIAANSGYLENKFVNADGNGADENRFELLVVLFAFGRTNIDNFPFQV
jgi:hypothetical protein